MKHGAVMQISDGQGEGDDADDGRDEDDGNRYPGGGHAAFEAGPTAQAVIEDTGPDEVELLFDAERPKMLERPHGGVGGVVTKEEKGAEDIDFGKDQPSGPAKEQKDGDVEVDRRQDAHGAPEVKAAHADGAALLLLVEKKVGDQIAADDEEDKYAGATVEDGIPDEGDMVGDAEPLEGMERDDKKDGQGSQTVEAGNAGHRCSSRGEGLGHIGGGLFRG